MAQFHFSGLDELMLDLEDVANLPEDVHDEMLNAMADVTVDAQKRAGRALGVEETGLTLRSIKKGKIKVQSGQRVVYITPTGTRLRGTKRIRNAEIAFVNEYGKRGQKARPFIRTGNEQSAEEATRAAAEVYDRYLKTKNL